MLYNIMLVSAVQQCVQWNTLAIRKNEVDLYVIAWKNI